MTQQSALGLAGGFVGSNKVLVSCLKCGHQWEPGKAQGSSELLSKRNVVIATLDKPNIAVRLLLGALCCVGLGALGLFLLLIPIIGWILGIICLIGAIATPYAALTDPDAFTTLNGKCPYCENQLRVPFKNKKHTCNKCQGELVIEGRKFYTLGALPTR